MWRCPECDEQLEDQFNSCWRCAGNADVNIASSADTPRQGKSRKFPLLAVAIAVFLFLAAPQFGNFFTHTVYRSATSSGTAYFVRQSDAFTTFVDLYVSDPRCSLCTMTKVAAVLDSPIGPYPQEAMWSRDGTVVAVRSENGRWQNAYDFRLRKSYGQEEGASSSIIALLRSRGGEGRIIFHNYDSYKTLSRRLYPWELLALDE